MVQEQANAISVNVLENYLLDRAASEQQALLG